MTDPLADKLGVGRSEMVALVGAGGKSSLLLGLGAELVATGSRVVVTTTTKMGADQIPRWATVCRTGADVADALERGDPVFLASNIGGGKVTGVAPEFADRVFAGAAADHVLVEADGARGRSLKAPAPHEPVIPAGTTLVVIVAGIDAVGRSIATAAHRPERVAALVGRALEDPVRPVDMARVLGHPEGGRRGVPMGARVTVALTKVKPGPAADAAAEITARLDTDRQIERVVTIDFLPGSAIDPEHGGSGR